MLTKEFTLLYPVDDETPLNFREQELLLKTVEIAKKAVAMGNHPFGCLLSNKNYDILLEQGNSEVSTGDCTAHAETELMRRASIQYSKEVLSECTMYTSAEPCAMCTAAAYWVGVGRIVYLLSETDLLACTGNDSRNPTLSLPSRVVIKSGQKNIKVLGPFPDLAGEYVKIHKKYWEPEKNN